MGENNVQNCLRSMNLSKKVAVLASTGGSVVRTVYSNTLRQDFDIDLLISDRECGATIFAKNNKIPIETLEWNDPLNGSKNLERILTKNEISYVYLFFTKLIKGAVLDKYKEKLINFHPSLLPACPGLHGFEETIKSGAILAGSTVHYIDNGTDTGRQIIQTYTPTIGVQQPRLRHIIFSQQCAALYYIHRKIKSGIKPDKFNDKDSSLDQGFYPNIDQESLHLYKKILSDEPAMH